MEQTMMNSRRSYSHFSDLLHDQNAIQDLENDPEI